MEYINKNGSFDTFGNLQANIFIFPASFYTKLIISPLLNSLLVDGVRSKDFL